MRILKKLVESFKVKHEDVYSRGVKLQVVENDRVRLFKLDGATNSKINKSSVYTGGYWDYLIPLVYAYRKPRILIIGLGLGTSVYQLRRLFGNKINIDAVELDENVVRLAKKYAPEGLGARITIGDGYEYVLDSKKRYDIIVLDAYGKGALIPKQFFRREFAGNAFRILNAKGTMAINYAMHPQGILKFGAYRKLLKKFFGVYSINVTGLGDTQLVLCSKALVKEELLKRIRHRIPEGGENRMLLEGYRRMKVL